jgi:hypothetical protein
MSRDVAEQLLAALDVAGGPRRRPLEAVEAAHYTVEPHLRASTERLPRLKALLEILAREGHLTLSGRTRLDGLPEAVRLPSASVTSARTPGHLLGPLHAELAAAHEDVSPGWTVGEVEAIRRVNRWLVEEDGVVAEPIARRERSFALFDDDKRLEQLTRLFERGIFSHRVLRTVPTPPPFPWLKVGNSPAILFVENSATFASLVEVLRSLEDPEWGYVGFAGGQGFAQRLPFVRELPGPPVQCMQYFGDVDPPGLSIPREAAAVALAEGLPPLLPELRLYEALLTRVDAQLSIEDAPVSVPGGWLPDQLAWRAAAVIHARGSLPQEALDRLALSRLLAARS